MKRLTAFLMALMLITMAVPALAEEGSPAAYSYDFDIRFRLNADSFPARVRTHLRGYSELLDILEMKGNLTFAAENDSVDLQLDIIPVTNPSAALSVHLFGIPEHMCMSSSLLGDETIWFNNFVLMEFALKTWNNLHLPLQYLVLLYPYVTENAFRQLVANWNDTVGTVTKGQKIPKDKLKKVAGLWAKTLQEDQRLQYWITGLAVLSEGNMVLESEINSLPEYFLEKVTGNRELTVKAGKGTMEWKNQAGETIYRSSEDEDGNSWSFTLPETGNGYFPSISWASASVNGLSSVSVQGSYHRDDVDSGIGDTGTVPASLLDFSLDIRSLPGTLPADSNFTVDLDITGSLIPNMSIVLNGGTKENGEIILSVFDHQDGVLSPESVLTCTGTVIPVEPQFVPDYKASELTRTINIFSVNDKTVSEFSQKIRRPLITGILNFLEEVPAGACQSVMDDLEEYGFLNLLLGEE